MLHHAELVKPHAWLYQITLNTSIPTSRYRVSMNHFAISADNELSLNIRVPSEKKFDLMIILAILILLIKGL
ncbi:hypothetical protein HSHS1_13090 [Helicobacter suis HS1]|nr:hypothetical protein HSHS1_13090 [Helicobacter suis HS1]